MKSPGLQWSPHYYILLFTLLLLVQVLNKIVYFDKENIVSRFIASINIIMLVLTDLSSINSLLG